MFFGLDIPFILNELDSKKELREYFKISEVLIKTLDNFMELRKKLNEL